MSVQQKITPAKAGVGLAYQFTIEDAQFDVTFTVDREQVNAKATKGKWNGNELKLTPAEEWWKPRSRWMQKYKLTHRLRRR